MDDATLEDKVRIAAALASSMECVEALADAITELSERVADQHTPKSAARSKLELVESAWRDASRAIEELRNAILFEPDAGDPRRESEVVPSKTAPSPKKDAAKD